MITPGSCYLRAYLAPAQLKNFSPSRFLRHRSVLCATYNYLTDKWVSMELNFIQLAYKRSLLFSLGLILIVAFLTRYRVQCSQDDTNSDYLTMRIVSPTCQMKSSVQEDILSIKRQVQDLQAKVDDILNLLTKPKIGKLTFTFTIPRFKLTICKRCYAKCQKCKFLKILR